jgi:hypothetical protein
LFWQVDIDSFSLFFFFFLLPGWQAVVVVVIKQQGLEFTRVVAVVGATILLRFWGSYVTYTAAVAAISLLLILLLLVIDSIVGALPSVITYRYLFSFSAMGNAEFPYRLGCIVFVQSATLQSNDSAKEVLTTCYSSPTYR